MYTINIPLTVQVRLTHFNKESPSITTQLADLLKNPYAKAQETKIPVIGKYYINAGRYAILFEINDEAKTIDCLGVVLRACLYKILTERIPPSLLPS